MIKTQNVNLFSSTLNIKATFSRYRRTGTSPTATDPRECNENKLQSLKFIALLSKFDLVFVVPCLRRGVILPAYHRVRLIKQQTMKWQQQDDDNDDDEKKVEQLKQFVANES